MIDTQLILLDGLPGTGTSSQAQWLEIQLLQAGHITHWYHEADPNNPLAWYWGLEPELTIDTVKRALAPHAVEQTLQRSIQIARNYVKSPQEDTGIDIFENMPFQSTVAIFLQHDISQERLSAYVAEFYSLLQVLCPMVIYFYPEDARALLEWICNVRGKGFEVELTTNMESLPFLRNRGLKGLDGIAELWEATRQFCDTLYANFCCPRLSINMTERNWEQYQHQILQFLAINPAIPVKRDMSIEGKYCSETNEIEVTLVDNEAVLIGRGKLVAKTASTFYIERQPVEVSFAENGMIIDETRFGGSKTVWIKQV